MSSQSQLFHRSPQLSRQTHKHEKPLWLCVLFWYELNSYITQILSFRNRSGSFVTQQVYQLLLLTGRASAVFFQHICSVMRGWPYHFLRVYQVLCDKMRSYLKSTFHSGAFASWYTRTRQKRISLWIFNEILIEMHWKYKNIQSRVVESTDFGTKSALKC